MNSVPHLRKMDSLGGRGRPKQGDAFDGWARIHKLVLFSSMLVVVVVLNVADLWTSSVALRSGFIEGNSFVTGLANSLGLSVIGSLALIKLASVSGGLFASILGVKIRDSIVRVVAMSVMLFLIVLLVVVVTNNLFIIR